MYTGHFGAMDIHAPQPVGYAARLGLFSGTMLVVGGIIGSGIFLSPSVVAQRVVFNQQATEEMVLLVFMGLAAEVVVVQET